MRLFSQAAERQKPTARSLQQTQDAGREPRDSQEKNGQSKTAPEGRLSDAQMAEVKSAKLKPGSWAVRSPEGLATPTAKKTT